MSIVTYKEGRNHAIDLMKFLAAILITNSHMVSLYPERFKILATGGAIGDSLFFFCSGFCLMMGRNIDFFNWYKKRINRIFPTIFAVAIIEILFRMSNPSLKDVIVNGGGWFVQAIFVFYFFFWFVKKFLNNKIWIAFIIVSIVVLTWFICAWDKDLFFLKDATYLRWPCFFMMMLFGAFISKKVNSQSENKTGVKSNNGWIILGLLLLSLLFYYGYQLIWTRFTILKRFQLILLPTLMLIVYLIYKLFTNDSLLAIYKKEKVYCVIYGISACCLEIYLSGSKCFPLGRSLINIFPLNIIITFLLVFVLAYVVKVFSNFLSQTFKTEKYDWKGMLML